MSAAGSDNLFAASVASLYERYLVPLIFAPYAIDIAARVARHKPSWVLEIAAGTGVVTRQLARVLPDAVAIVATDLNQPMLDQAASIGASRPLQWQQADAMRLPFPDQSFDAVVCQFGAMFFPDRPKAFAEARRVLRPGGVFLFNVWDSIDQNEFAATVTQALADVFADDPPRFLARVPHGYHDVAIIARDLANGGFTQTPEFDTIAARSRADSPDVPAIAYCQGTPLRNEIEQRRATGLTEATAAATTAIARRFGAGAVDGKIQAHVVAIER
jgi:SAM-dependent methyltransferase